MNRAPRSGWLVLADDLTGAADTAVALAGADEYASACVLLVGAHTPPASALAEAAGHVVALDLHTRALSEAQAAARFGAIADAAQRSGRRLYKKIDSLLRGHLGAELASFDAGLDAVRRPSDTAKAWIVAPAHPTLGRTLVDGRLQVLGEASATDLATALAAAGFRCRSVPAESTAIDDALGTCRDAAGRVALVCDATTPADLHRLAQASLIVAHVRGWVGSGGLAFALADCDTALPGEAAGAPSINASASAGRLFVIGSHAPMALRQIAALAEVPNVHAVVLQAAALSDARLDEVGAALDRVLARGDDALLHVEPATPLALDAAAHVAAAIARTVVPRLERLGGLVVGGGETARAIFDRAGVRSLTVRRSTETGSSHARADLFPSLPIILKAGAFGDHGSLLRLRSLLTTA